jgi:hypothetical protein
MQTPFPLRTVGARKDSRWFFRFFFKFFIGGYFFASRLGGYFFVPAKVERGTSFYTRESRCSFLYSTVPGTSQFTSNCGHFYLPVLGDSGVRDNNSIYSTPNATVAALQQRQHADDSTV